MESNNTNDKKSKDFERYTEISVNYNSVSGFVNMELSNSFNSLILKKIIDKFIKKHNITSDDFNTVLENKINISARIDNVTFEVILPREITKDESLLLVSAFIRYYHSLIENE